MPRSELDAVDLAVARAAGAQAPRLAWRPNHPPARRSIDQARALVAAEGIDVPDDVRFVERDDAHFASDVYAAFGGFKSTSWYRWDDLLRDGAVVVKVRASVFESDEAILAVFAHELHEIEGLRSSFEQGPVLGAKLIREIEPDRRGNLHDEAWDVADAAVASQRTKMGAP